MNATCLLLTVTGRDRPGVTGALFAALAGHDVEILDVEQVVIRGRLTLGVLLSARGDLATIRRGVTTACTALGVEAEMVESDLPDAIVSPRPNRAGRHHVILVGRPLRAGAISEVAQSIAHCGGNIDSIIQLAHEPVSSLELIVSGVETAPLRVALSQSAAQTGIDIAVEAAGLRRRAKRLVVLDVDSTLVQGEGIDLLADRAGAGEAVQRITEQAMAGELDFAESLTKRVALLAGLPISEVHDVRDLLQLTPGAATLVRTLHRLGFRVGVVSGGFTVFTDRFVRELQLDFAAANELEVVDGRLTGRVVGPVVDRAGKATALAHFAAQFGIPLEQTVAIGDGANDIDMIEAAG
ncbi:MAG: Phosphoserine phosphatase, partial [Jatrophihabitantaceae bacterium]|nr:Phosphoserine phosphatase [Jatrophihabitantaceae bacterium]